MADKKNIWYNGITEDEALSMDSPHNCPIVDADYRLVDVKQARLYGRKIDKDIVALVFGLDISDGQHGCSWCIPEARDIKIFLNRMKVNHPTQLNGKYIRVYIDKSDDIRGISVQ